MHGYNDVTRCLLISDENFEPVFQFAPRNVREVLSSGTVLSE